jgi:hypothetical protein
MAMDQFLAGRIRDSINLYSRGIGADPYDICGIIGVETFGTWDPNLEGDLTSPYGPSEGLMQIGYVIARDQYGFTGSIADLRVPETNIYYGCRHLRWTYDYLFNNALGLVAKYGPWYSAIVAYNCGVGNFINGNWSASYYVDKVISYRDRYRTYGVTIDGIQVYPSASGGGGGGEPAPPPSPVPTGPDVIDVLTKWQTELNKVLSKDRQARPWPPESDYNTDIGKTVYNLATTINATKDRIFEWLGQIDNYNRPT